MITNYRTKGYVKLYTQEQMQRIKDKCCPICNLSKEKWKRRTDWTCCSKECTEEFSKLFTSWQFFKHKAFRRDSYTCVKCGFVCPKDKYTISKLKEDGTYDYEQIEGECFDTTKIVADHIEPIALGGEEFELDNIQTLCIECNKIKTREDLRKIAVERNLPQTQTKLEVSNMAIAVNHGIANI